jgi:hypothetical protein
LLTKVAKVGMSFSIGITIVINAAGLVAAQTNAKPVEWNASVWQ